MSWIRLSIGRFSGDYRWPLLGDSRGEQLEHYANEGVLAVEMQAASLFAFAEARRASVGLIAHVTNAINHEGQPFDKGPEDFGFRLFEAICRSGLRR